MYKQITKVKKIQYNNQKIREFAVFFSLIIIVGLLFFDVSDTGRNYLYLFLVYLLASILKPAMLRYVFVIWMFLSFVLGDLIFGILFAFFYYLLITPIAYIMRMKKGDFLQKKYNKNLKTYWVDYDQERINKKNLENLF